MKKFALGLFYTLAASIIILVQCENSNRQDELERLSSQLLNMSIEQVESASYRIGGNFLEDEQFVEEVELPLSKVATILNSLARREDKLHISLPLGCSLRLKLSDGALFYIAISVNSDERIAAIQPYQVISGGGMLVPSRGEDQFQFIVPVGILLKALGRNSVDRVFHHCPLDVYRR